MASDEADDAFMYFDLTKTPKIEGGAKDKRVIYVDDASMADVKAFQISEVSFSVDNSANIGSATNPAGGTGAGEGGDTGKVKFNPISVKKQTDLCTPNLILACALGVKYPWAKIELRRNGMTYLKITLRGVVLATVNFAQSDDSEASDTLSIHYEKIYIEYCEQDYDGELFVPTASGWDRVENVQHSE